MEEEREGVKREEGEGGEEREVGGDHPTLKYGGRPCFSSQGGRLRLTDLPPLASYIPRVLGI